MRPPRLLGIALVPPAVLIGVAGCTAEGDGSTVPASTATSSATPASTSTPPTLAGGAEASAVAGLPAGPASGTAVLVYSGVGEVREPFTGECARDGDTTRIEGTADTAGIRLDVGPDGAQLALDDLGFSATSTLTTGRYDVEGGHLSLSAGLTRDDQAVGSVELEIDCGG